MTDQELIEEFKADDEIIFRRLDYWAEQQGDKPYFYYGEDDFVLTFAEFASLTDAVAGNLATRGINKGDHVSVFVRNSFVGAVAMFGIWKVGGVFCPINFNYAGRLLTYQLNDTKPHLLITERAMVDVLNEVRENLTSLPHVIIYDAAAKAHDYISEDKRALLNPGFEQSSWADLIVKATPPQVEIEFYDIANIIYTSGTTGPSKGGVQSYRWMNQYTFLPRKLLTKDDVIYNDLPLYHIAGSIANVGRAAWVGCKVAVWDKFSPGNFWERVEHSQASTAILLDVMIPWLMNVPPKPNDKINTLNKIHMQPFPQHHAEVAHRFGFDLVTAGFGQTESGFTIAAFLEDCEDGHGTPPQLYKGYSRAELRQIANRYGLPVVYGPDITTKGFMGKPLPFVEVKVLNEKDVECPAGEVGQLCFRSRLPWLFVHEYLGKPEATLKAFRNLWFHTGDAAYQDQEGIFYFVDRMGDRIRSRGENISSYHIEDLINHHPAVQYCAAFPIPSIEGEEDDIVVFVVAKDQAQLEEQELKIWAEREMPKFMRPRHFRIVEDIPRTPTNKVEKYKLRQQILQELGKP